MGISMKQSVLSIFFGLMFTSLTAQNFETYTVDKSTDLPQLAQQFNVSVTDILNYNPDVSRYTDLKGKTLVIPLLESSDQVKEFKTYQVSPQETLYRIAQKFKVEVETIIRYNEFLKERQLDVNDVLQIPVLKRPTQSKNQSLKNSSFSSLKHLVLPKETKYGIAKSYGITVEDLERLNPDKEVLQPGDYVIIKRTLEQASLPAKNNLDYVKVQSKEDVDLLKRQFQLSDELLKQLNPAYRLGQIDSDFVLRFPRNKPVTDQRIDLINYINDSLPKRVALVLPFNLHKFDNDTVNKSKLLIDQRISRISLDIYQGARAAVDSAKQLGLFTSLEVFDTGMETNQFNQLISKHNFSSFDAVVGPVLQSHISLLAEELKLSQTPLILPITTSPVNQANIYNSIPKDQFKEELILTYINQHITDSTHIAFYTDSLHVDFQQKLKYTFPEASEVTLQENYLQPEDLEPTLKKDQINWFVLDTKDLGIAEAVVSYLVSLNRKGYQVKLFMPSNTVLRDEISNFYLARLGFTYAATSFDVSSYKESTEEETQAYKSKYFLRGFDVMLDTILRLAIAQGFSSETQLDGFTEYYQNKFNYQYDSFDHINENSAVYLIEYQADLSLSVLQVEN